MLSAQQQLDLIKGVTTQEVKKAMFSINVNKSPGPDVYGAGFYKYVWRVVGKDITNIVL